MKKIYSMLLMLTALMVYSSCTSEVDDVFDKSSATRIGEALSADKDILTSAANGWLMEYYGDTQYGGYNILCKFNTDNTVKVESEVYGSDSTYTSHFKLEQSQGVILSFDENNPLFHYFSNPGNPDSIGTNGKGMNGDFEFRVQKATADSIILIGKKHESKIIMTPMANGVDWDGYLDEVASVAKNMSYKNYGIIVGKDTFSVSSSYRKLTFTDPTTGTDVEMPYIQTPKGYKLYKPVTYAGKTITGFNYSDDDLWVNPADNTVKLIPIVPPLTTQFVNNYWFISYSNLGTFAQKYWNVVKQGADALGETVIYAFFGTYTLGTYGSHFGLTFDSGGYWGQYVFTYTVLGSNEIKMEYSGTNISNASWYADNANYNYGAFPFGYKGSARTFKLSTDNLKAPTYIKLTDESDPTNVITLSASAISNVFAH